MKYLSFQTNLANSRPQWAKFDHMDVCVLARTLFKQVARNPREAKLQYIGGTGRDTKPSVFDTRGVPKAVPHSPLQPTT